MLVKIAEFLGQVTDRCSTIAIAALIVTIAFGSLDYFLDIGMTRIGVRPELHALLLACLVGAGAGIAALVVLLSRRERRRIVYDELRRVAELNHSLRNSLEIIADAHYTAESEQHRRLVFETIEAMDANLKRLFPSLGIEYRRKAGRHSSSQGGSRRRVA